MPFDIDSWDFGIDPTDDGEGDADLEYDDLDDDELQDGDDFFQTN